MNAFFPISGGIDDHERALGAAAVSGSARLRKRRRVGLLLTLLLVAPTAPTQAADLTLRVMTWNIHHGEGTDGQVDLERIAAVIKAEEVALVALQEVDKGVERTNRRDLAGELAALTGMTALFSNNFSYQGGEYGNAILSRLPVTSWNNTHLRMLRPGEQRGVLQATVDWHGIPLRFLSTHIDYRRDDAERLANVAEFQQLAARSATRYFMIAGDFNDFPDSRTHRVMSETFAEAWGSAGVGEGFTFSSDRPRSRIDYLWVIRGSPLQPARVWIPQTTASDHLPLVAEFTVEP